LHLDFDVEAWYEWLQPLTFATRFAPLGLAQARALIAHYRYRYNHGRPLTADELRQLRDLEAAIDAEIRAARSKLGGSAEFFVRLSVRSPKDAVGVTPEEYEDALRRVEADEAYAGAGAEHETNRRMVALSDCQAGLAVASGRAAMRLLTSSERIFVDLITATDTEELYNTHPVNVVLRVWEKRLNHRMEFRAFVSKGRLTAISQYNHDCYFPEVARRKEDIRVLLVSYWESEVKARVPLADYIVDFAVLGLLEDRRVAVVELNPFATTTGPALFNWRVDADVLAQGPLAFRVHEAPLAQIAELVEYSVGEVYSPSEDNAGADEVAWSPRSAEPSQEGRRCSVM